MGNVFRSIIRALSRQRLIFWSVVVLALAAAGAASVWLPTVWRSTAVVMVPQGMNEQAGIDLLASRDLHRQVLARLGADNPYAGLTPEAAVDALGKALSAYPRSLDSYAVTYDSPQRDQAAPVVRAVIAVWGEQRAQMAAQAANGLLDHQRAVLRAAVDETQAKLDDYRRSHNTWNADEERQRLLRQRNDLDSEDRRLAATIDDDDSKIRTLKDQMDRALEMPEGNEQAGRYKVVDETKARLLELKLKEQDLLAKYTETSQFVITVRDQIRQVQGFLDEMQTTMNARGAKPAGGDIATELTKERIRNEREVTTAQSRRNAIAAQRIEIERRLAEMDSRDGELHRLETALADGTTDLRRLDGAQLAQSLGAAGHGSGLAVVERPSEPTRPWQPDPPLYLSLALACGVLGGLALAVLADAFSATFAGPGDVERRLGLPVLAALPHKS